MQNETLRPLLKEEFTRIDRLEVIRSHKPRLGHATLDFKKLLILIVFKVVMRPRFFVNNYWLNRYVAFLLEGVALDV